MARLSEVAAALIGCEVVDADGRRLGRTVAVIHRAHGSDVLVEGRRWLRHRSYRFALDDIIPLADGRLLVSPEHPAAVRRIRQRVGADRVAGGEQR
jgi:hypothetical protein